MAGLLAGSLRRTKLLARLLVPLPRNLDVSRARAEVKKYREALASGFNVLPAVVAERIDRDSPPVVSVITPAFNAGGFLRSLHDSIQQLSNADSIEWVVIDDGSTDDTVDVLEQIARLTQLKRFKFYSIPNCGAAHALRTAAECADGEYIAWISADDEYIDNRKIEEDLALARAGACLVFSRRTYFGAHHDAKEFVEVPEWYVEGKPLEQLSRIFVFNKLNGSSSFFSRDTYRAAGGFDSYLLNVDADFDLWARFLILGARVQLSVSSVFNRVHRQQTSASLEKMFIGMNLTRLRLLLMIQELELDDEFRAALARETATFYRHVSFREELLVSTTTVPLFFEAAGVDVLPKELRGLFGRYMCKHREKYYELEEDIVSLASDLLKTPACATFLKKARSLRNRR
jgi:glycosyltransferase involved in cell wall biosynthesis